MRDEWGAKTKTLWYGGIAGQRGKVQMGGIASSSAVLLRDGGVHPRGRSSLGNGDEW
jgi:hypothetical protein